jgi:hypothetical protein
MRYLFAILFVCIFNLAIVDMTRGEVREMMQWYKDNGCVDRGYSMQSMG